MSVSSSPIIGTTASVTAGTAVVPLQAPFDNTHTIIIFNESTTQKLFVAFTEEIAIAEANAVVVPTNSTLTLPIGTKSERPPIGTLKFDCDGGTITARISYLNGLGS